MAALSSLLAGVQQSGEQLEHGLGPQLLRLFTIVLQPRYMRWASTQPAHHAAPLLLDYVEGLAACAGYASTFDHERELSDALAFVIKSVDTTLSALSATGTGDSGTGALSTG